MNLDTNGKTLSLDQFSAARPREVVMKIGYETNVFGDSPRQGGELTSIVHS